MNNFCLECGPIICPGFEACPKCDTKIKKKIYSKKDYHWSYGFERLPEQPS